jgi:hypothetical protein
MKMIDLVKEMIENRTLTACVRPNTEIEYKGKTYTYRNKDTNTALFEALYSHDNVEEIRDERHNLLAYIIPTTEASVTIVFDGGFIRTIVDFN